MFIGVAIEFCCWRQKGANQYSENSPGNDE